MSGLSRNFILITGYQFLMEGRGNYIRQVSDTGNLTKAYDWAVTPPDTMKAIISPLSAEMGVT